MLPRIVLVCSFFLFWCSILTVGSLRPFRQRQGNRWCRSRVKHIATKDWPHGMTSWRALSIQAASDPTIGYTSRRGCDKRRLAFAIVDDGSKGNSKGAFGCNWIFLGEWAWSFCGRGWCCVRDPSLLLFFMVLCNVSHLLFFAGHDESVYWSAGLLLCHCSMVVLVGVGIENWECVLAWEWEAGRMDMRERRHRAGAPKWQKTAILHFWEMSILLLLVRGRALGYCGGKWAMLCIDWDGSINVTDQNGAVYWCFIDSYVKSYAIISIILL